LSSAAAAQVLQVPEQETERVAHDKFFEFGCGTVCLPKVEIRFLDDFVSG